MPVTGKGLCSIGSVLGFGLNEDEAVAPGGDGPDRKADDTGLGQTAVEELEVPTALACLKVRVWGAD